MRKSIWLGLLLLAFSLPTFAQNVDVEGLAGIQFDFGNPGARSLGMGGAFLGRADDATAAEANPAGLTIIRRPEITVEGRNFETTRSFTNSGTFPNFTQQDFSAFSRRAEMSFASVVLPVKNFSVAAYYSHPVAFRNTVAAGTSSINFFLGPNGPVDQSQCTQLGTTCQQYRLFPFGSAVDIDFKTFGLAGAYKLGNLSLGAAARYHKMSEAAFTLRTDFVGNPQAGLAQVADDNDITFSAGFKWAASSRFSFGGVYKQGAKIDTKFLFGNFSAADATVQQVGTPTFHIPDVYGLGISLQPTTSLTINADAVQVNYSNLTDNFMSIYDDIKDNPAFKAEDVLELRVGAEYFFNTRIPLAVRAGWWRDEAHQIYYNGPIVTANQVAASIIYPKGKNQNHASVGLGLAWQHFSIDAAYDTSDNYKVGSLTGKASF